VGRRRLISNGIVAPCLKDAVHSPEMFLPAGRNCGNSRLVWALKYAGFDSKRSDL